MTFDWNDFLVQAIFHILAASGCGAIIGIERSYNGHNAGLRTHVLVSMASCLLMFIAVKMDLWLPNYGKGMMVVIHPAQMAQGIMTGIGFLGAGVILKSGLSVRGLTTAACIWTTATIGIIVGIGFYGAAIATTVIALLVLCGFRWTDRFIGSNVYAKITIKFPEKNTKSEEEIRNIFHSCKIKIVTMNYESLIDDKGDRCFIYNMDTKTRDVTNFSALKNNLNLLTETIGFKVSLSGDN